MSKTPSILYKTSDEHFVELVKSAKSYADILRGCNILYKGGNVNTVKRRVIKMGIDDSHIPRGVGSNKNRIFEYRRYSIADAMQNVFTSNSTVKRETVKSLLVRFNLIPHRCDCGLKDCWNNKPLTLQLEHKNGKSTDNRVENLCFMCPNCHSQTTTFAGRNSRKK